MRPTKGENQGIKRFLSGRRNARAGRFRRRKGQAITRRSGRARKGARERDNHGRRASPPSGVLPERPAFPLRVAPARSFRKEKEAGVWSFPSLPPFPSSLFPLRVPASACSRVRLFPLRVPASLPRRGAPFTRSLRRPASPFLPAPRRVARPVLPSLYPSPPRGKMLSPSRRPSAA